MTELVCIVCPQGCRLQVDETDNYAVSGQGCPRGEAYGKKELLAPTRTLTSTVRLTGGTLCRAPVKTAGEIPKPLVLPAMRALNKVTLTAPVHLGDVVLANLLGTGVDVVATRTMPKAGA